MVPADGIEQVAGWDEEIAFAVRFIGSDKAEAARVDLDGAGDAFADGRQLQQPLGIDGDSFVTQEFFECLNELVMLIIFDAELCSQAFAVDRLIALIAQVGDDLGCESERHGGGTPWVCQLACAFV
ncbi:MAG: hypothetical protein HND57_13910 [Planctomycetes bacterium]|nr:hypothetical protein [Planctomycetota bacterium]